MNKFYYSIITSFLKDPNFISQRLKKFSNDYAIICDPARGKLVNENGKIQRMVETPFEWTSFCFHCNGIICISDRNLTETYLVNPAIKEFHRIPQPETHAKILLGGMGLGFDSVARNFKVIRIGIGSDHRTVVEIYSLSTDAWRVITAPIPLKPYYNVFKTIFCDGVFYWSFSGMKRASILCFNMYDEVLYTIPVPENFYNENKGWTITIFNGSFALITYPLFQYIKLVVEVWVVDSLCPNVQWKKLLSIGPLAPHIQGTPLDFWKMDELLIHHPLGFGTSYNIRTRKTFGVLLSDKAFGYTPQVFSVRPRIQ